MIGKVIDAFKLVYDEKEHKYVERLIINMPIEPNNNLLEKMSNKCMIEFKEKLQKMKENLDKAYEEEDPVIACEYLNKSFGSDFTIPERQETAKYKKQAVTGSLEGA